MLADEPRSAIERILVAIWQETLGLDERIGIHDDFFNLGGHSLLGIEAAARISIRFAVRVSVKTVFEAPTVAAMGAVIAGECPAAECAP